MSRQRATGVLGLATVAATFVTYGAMALGGTEPAGTLHAGEHQTATAAGLVAVVLAVALVAVTRREASGVRAVALALAAAALAAPAVHTAAQDVETSSDAMTCGTVTSPAVYAREEWRAACASALGDQRRVVALLTTVPLLLAGASVVTASRRGPSDTAQVVPPGDGTDQPTTR